MLEKMIKEGIETVLRVMCFGRQREWSEDMVDKIYKTSVVYDNCIVDGAAINVDIVISALMEIAFNECEVKEMKKYTLKNWKEFCEDALIVPPFEDDKQLEEWFNTHKIHIAANNCVMELEYDADAVNEIEFAIQEINEAINGDGASTTGNTVGSEYPNATWKDILRYATLYYHYEGMSLKEAIQKCIHNLSGSELKEVMQEIEGQPSLDDELQVNFLKLNTIDFWKIFDEEERRQAFKELLCSNIELEELYDEKGRCADKVVITDYSIKPFGEIIGWHYGVDWDKDSEDNQYYIQEYIEEMTK